MKKESLLFVFAVLLAGCVKQPAVGPSGGAKDLADEVKRLSTTEELRVEVPVGSIARISMDGVVLAELVKSATVLVPRSSSLTRGAAVKTEMFPSDDYPNVIENSSKLYQVVCFEDSREADYDYNDLVIHVKYQTRGDWFGFAVQPVALGSKKAVDLGYVLYRGTTQVAKGLINSLGRNCRDQFFQGQEGYVNTALWEPQPNFFPRDPEVGGWHEYLGSTIRKWNMSQFEGSGMARVEWFIQVDRNEANPEGTELYALSTSYLGQSFTKDEIPYGLVISHTGIGYTDKGEVCGYDWFNYPAEARHIGKVYPKLWEWLTTDTVYDFSDFYSASAPAGAYPAADLGLFSVTDLNVL